MARSANGLRRRTAQPESATAAKNEASAANSPDGPTSTPPANASAAIASGRRSRTGAVMARVDVEHRDREWLLEDANGMISGRCPGSSVQLSIDGPRNVLLPGRPMILASRRIVLPALA